ncbi:hypothetical protein [Leuconostoc mesenteroides]|uniref:hypothetical protein n=2 Tax=Leuconostoc mesenteroides TaxID=1245 RepID=UPI0023619346|nr:hypothetical protein [Leuconostoc mesenteroides]
MRLTDLEDLTQYMSLDTKLLVQTEDFVNPVTAIKYANNHSDIILLANDQTNAMTLSQLFARLRTLPANTILLTENNQPIFGFYLDNQYNIIFK